MRKQKLLTKALAASMAVFMSVSQLSVPAFAAEGTKSVSIAGSTYTYSAEALEGYTQIGNSGLYYKLIDGSGLSGTLYGKSNLTYKEFYSGDVSSMLLLLPALLSILFYLMPGQIMRRKVQKLQEDIM